MIEFTVINLKDSIMGLYKNGILINSGHFYDNEISGWVSGYIDAVKDFSITCSYENKVYYQDVIIDYFWNSLPYNLDDFYKIIKKIDDGDIQQRYCIACDGEYPHHKNNEGFICISCKTLNKENNEQ